MQRGAAAGATSEPRMTRQLRQGEARAEHGRLNEQESGDRFVNRLLGQPGDEYVPILSCRCEQAIFPEPGQLHGPSLVVGFQRADDPLVSIGHRWFVIANH